MKKLFYLLVILLATCCTPCKAQAQQQEEYVSVPKSQLTEQQKQSLESQTLQEKIETYAKWSGVGKEIGVAVREGLTAVVDVSTKFAGTDVGKFTMVLIAWKVVGKDVTSLFLGVLLIIVFNYILFKVYRNTFVTHRVRKSGVWWKFWEPSEYVIVEPQDWEGSGFISTIIYPVFVVASFGIAYAIMF